ncbi:hypothetical protein SABR111722_20255 [Saccharibacillus brassicae]
MVGGKKKRPGRARESGAGTGLFASGRRPRAFGALRPRRTPRHRTGRRRRTDEAGGAYSRECGLFSSASAMLSPYDKPSDS